MNLRATIKRVTQSIFQIGTGLAVYTGLALSPFTPPSFAGERIAVSISRNNLQLTELPCVGMLKNRFYINGLDVSDSKLLLSRLSELLMTRKITLDYSGECDYVLFGAAEVKREPSVNLAGKAASKLVAVGICQKKLVLCNSLNAYFFDQGEITFEEIGRGIMILIEGGDVGWSVHKY